MITVEKIMVLGADGKYRTIARETPATLESKRDLERFRTGLKVRFQTTGVRFEYEEDEV